MVSKEQRVFIVLLSTMQLENRVVLFSGLIEKCLKKLLQPVPLFWIQLQVRRNRQYLGSKQKAAQ